MKRKLSRAAIVWVQLAFGVMIAGALAFLGVGLVFVAPICNRLVLDSAAGPRGFDAFLPGATSFLALLHLLVDYAAWWAVALLIVGVIFERRVRAENKPVWRLSALGGTALLTGAAAMVFAALMVIPTVKAAQQVNARHPEPFVRGRMATLDHSVRQLDEALVARDWPTVHESAHVAMGAADDLATTGAAAATLLTFSESTKLEELRKRFDVMADALRKAWAASRRDGNVERAEAAMQMFHEAYRDVPREPASGN
jgi:hypothetical protein